MRLYVGNLAKEVTEDDVRQAFQSFGSIEEVSIVKDRSNGVSKGFAFVEMPVGDEAKSAIAGLKGKELKGRSMDVSEARPKTDRHSGGGRRW